jgi:serine/threonine-protein kinase
MIYQLLSGALPFRAASMAELMFKIANEPAPDVRTVNPQVPEALARVVAKALAKHHAERYASGTLMAQDLNALLRVYPGDAQSTSSEMLPTATAEPAAEFAKTVIMTPPRDTQRPTASTFSTLGGDHEL